MAEGQCVVTMGCGVYGHRVARELVRSGFFPDVIIAARDVEKAESLAAELRGAVNVSARYVDADDRQTLIQVMKEGDVVVNMIGPYARYGLKTAQAAIEAGMDYVDACDRWDVTRDQLTLDESARKAGVTILIGMGATPGLANIFARSCADQMDQVDEVHIIHAFIQPPGSVQAWGTRLGYLSREVPTYRDGKLINIPVIPNIETRELLEPRGVFETFPSALTQVITMPRFMKGVRTVTMRAAYLPPRVTELTRFILDYGLMSSEAIKVGDTTVKISDFTAAFCASEAGARAMGFREVEPFVALQVKVEGKKRGKPITCSYHFKDSDQFRWVATPVAIGAQMIARGDIQQKGVITPEAIDPKPMLNEILKWNATCHMVKDQVL